MTVTGFGQQKNFIDENYIEVTGSAEMEVTPDEIYLQVFISEKDDKRKETLEELEQKMFDQLKKAGVDVEKNVSISNVMSYLNARWLRKDNIGSGKKYQILAHDAATVEKMYQLLNEIEIKEKASDLAEAIGQKVGKAIHITETPENPYWHGNQSAISNMYVGNIREESARMDDVQVEFEKIKIRYKMGAKFRLE